MVVDYRPYLKCEVCQLMEVSSKQAVRVYILRDMIRDRPGQSESVVGGSSPPQLVYEYEGVGGGALEDGGCLQHLQHEGGDAAQLGVTGSHAREYSVH